MLAVRGRRRAASSACLRRRCSRGFGGGNASLVREHQRTRGWFELARLMGTSVEQIDRTYGHLLPDSLDRARVALDSLVATGEKAVTSSDG